MIAKINKLKKQLVNSGWDKVTLELGIESEFRCQYCNCDFFLTVNNYDSIQLDHLIPLKFGGTQNIKNLVLSCRTCNFIKRNWIPEKVISKGESRDILINLVKDYIKEKREIKEEKIKHEKQIVVQLLKEIKISTANQ